MDETTKRKKVAAKRRKAKIDRYFMPDNDERKRLYFYIDMAQRFTALGDLRKLSGQSAKSKKAYKDAGDWQDKAIAEEKKLCEKILK